MNTDLMCHNTKPVTLLLTLEMLANHITILLYLIKILPQVEIILDLKRSRCATLDSSDDDDCYGSPTKRCRMSAKKITVRRIPHHESPRSQYVGKDTTQWRSVCVNAGSGFEHALPTLEEAAHMFGHNQ